MSAMRFTHEVRYDAPPAEVYALLTDPKFREAASLAQDATHLTVVVEGGDVRIDMVTPMTDIPSFAKAIAGDTTHVIQTEGWREDLTADFKVHTPGKPGDIIGTRALVADGSGTRDTFEGESKVKIPLVGGKIEALIARKLQEGWDKEHVVGVRWLKGERG